MAGNTMVTKKIDEQEVVEVLGIYRKCPADKKAVIIAFMQGMEAQKAINEIISNDCKNAM